jgi:hypothetical protein
MNQINKGTYLKLNKLVNLFLIKKQLNVISYSNSYLNLVKPLNIFLDKYKDFLKNRSCFANNLNFIKNFIYLNYKIIFKKKFFLLTNYKKKIDIVLLSHLVNLDFKQDLYFSHIINDLKKRKIVFLIIFINHTNYSEKDINIKLKIFYPNYLIISSKYSYFIKYRFILKLIEEFIKIYKLELKEKNELKKRFIKHLKFQIFSGSTFLNLNIYNVIHKIIEFYKPRNFLSTYEGHTYEKLSYFAVKNASLHTKCIGYINSVIFPLQKSLKFLSINKFNPDKILTSGTQINKLLIKNLLIKKKHLINIGSNKILFVNSKIKKIKNKNILVAPQGLDEEIIFLFNFTIKCAELYKDYNFFFRFHPIINKKNFIKKFFINAFLPTNFYFSDVDLEKDLNRCSWLIYRGSTVVYNAVVHSLYPIYVNHINEISIDPLIGSHWRSFVNKPSQLSNIFIFKKNKNKKKKRYTTKYIKSLFETYKSNKFINIIKS